jgi:antitoxin (DNA-binding transcriptional repressor) of toxin-antitoxin stability system
MDWKIAEAKQRFSELVKAAGDEPQWIYNRDKLVAAVVPPENLREFLDWRRRKQTETLGDAFAKLRLLCDEEEYALEIPPRRERPNPFPDVLDELSR